MESQTISVEINAFLERSAKAAIGALRSLEQTAIMLERWAPECFPANEAGQVHFARAMMESSADAIRAAWSKAIAAATATTPIEGADAKALIAEASETARQRAALALIVREFLQCAEIADCAPEDLDPETREIERRARALLDGRPAIRPAVDPDSAPSAEALTAIDASATR